jgi:hypothetical protein
VSERNAHRKEREVRKLWLHVKSGGAICCLPFAATLLVIGGFCLTYRFSPNFAWLSKWLCLIEAQRAGFVTAKLKAQALQQSDLIQLTTNAAYTTWTTIFAFYALSCVAVIVVATCVIWKCLAGSRLAKLGALSVILSGCTLVSLLFSFARSILPTHEEDFFEIMMGASSLESIANPVKYHLWLDPVGMGIVMLAAVATSAALLPAAVPPLSGERGYFVQRSQYLRYILAAGTLMLIFATLRLSTLFHLALALLKPLGEVSGVPAAAIAHESIGEMVSTIVMVMGSLYSIFLAVAYLPAAYLLNREAGEMGGLPISEQLLRLAAIMGPFIAGSLGEVLSRIG